MVGEATLAVRALERRVGLGDDRRARRVATGPIGVACRDLGAIRDPHLCPRGRRTETERRARDCHVHRQEAGERKAAIIAA